MFGPRTAALALLVVLWNVSPPARAEHADDFSDMSLEDLLNVEVLSASKKAEALAETTSAVYVISAEDIRRSGFTALPELLRLVPGMEVSRVTSNTWALSARGFDGQFANKLLVLMDGRSLYTPTFAGVFWDDHDIPLHDIERIEVIRGPGGTIWGANAVNGVINIITKRAQDTQGSHASAIAGSEDRLITSFRHGREIGDDAFVRVFGHYANRDESIFRDHSQAHDEWRNGRSGVRADWQRGERDSFTFDAELHSSDTRFPLQIDDALNQALGIGTRTQIFDTIHGRGWLGRFGWTRALGRDSSIELSSSYDRRDRTAHAHYEETRAAYDVAVQHRFSFAERHDVVWGASYRLNRDRIDNTPNLRLGRDDAQDVVYGAFAQDDIAVSERLKLTFGSKFEWNDYTGCEIQPSARARLAPGPSHAIRAAVSPAVASSTPASRTTMTGEPQAWASSATMPKVSYLPGCTNRSAAEYKSARRCADSQ